METDRKRIIKCDLTGEVSGGYKCYFEYHACGSDVGNGGGVAYVLVYVVDGMVSDVVWMVSLLCKY